MLRELAAHSDFLWCIIGDFNDIMVKEEKQGSCSHPQRLIHGFTEATNDCQLIDLGFNDNMFTWEKSRDTERWVQERLDRGLANRQWKDMFPDTDVKVLDMSASDHLPLHLQLNRKMYVPKKHIFEFENMWLKEKDCLHIIQQCWAEMANHGITEKIQHCCLKLEECKKYMGLDSENSRNARSILASKSQTIVAAKWGSKFANGKWQEEEKQVQAIIVNYFENLFTTSMNDDEFLVPEEGVQQVTPVQNQELMQIVTREEVREAIFSMHPDKSPGMDGLNP
ncbi:uncharacterized protein LOC141714661 [Apium graveolens]|uniref:uncharacterized protein LOC141714661 n=1 Tax=Apium graveolens TaxID=4045 RepID=UPI003D7B9622